MEIFIHHSNQIINSGSLSRPKALGTMEKAGNAVLGIPIGQFATELRAIAPLSLPHGLAPESKGISGLPAIGGIPGLYHDHIEVW